MPSLFFLEPRGIQESLYPFCLIREVVDLRVGLLSFHQKWARLQSKSSATVRAKAFSIRANLVPTDSIWQQMVRLKSGQSLFDGSGNWLATAGAIHAFPPGQSIRNERIAADAALIQYPWDLLQQLESGVLLDFRLLTSGRRSLAIPKTSTVIGKHPVFLDRGAQVKQAVFNTEAGPIYIGKAAVVQEGALIRGPFLLGDGAVVTMGAKITGATAVGEGGVVGGEIKRSLLFPNSNKAHEGYMGDSVIGSWCNWGAGTSNSNIKNTAGIIRVRVGKKLMEVGQKCGVFMGDHSRTVIHASLNSGAVFGVSVQIGNGPLTSKRTPSFNWMDGKRYRLQEALEHIRNWKALKGQELTDSETERLKWIYKTDK